jgi:hypothetical protein
MRVKLIANVGVERLLIGGDGKVIDLTKEYDIFVAKLCAVEAWSMNRGAKTVLAENSVDVF